MSTTDTDTDDPTHYLKSRIPVSVTTNREYSNKTQPNSIIPSSFCGCSMCWCSKFGGKFAYTLFIPLFTFMVGLILSKNILLLIYPSTTETAATATATATTIPTINVHHGNRDSDSINRILYITEHDVDEDDDIHNSAEAAVLADNINRKHSKNNNKNKKQNFIAERFLYFADAWVDHPSGFFGETYFARKLMRSSFEHSLNASSVLGYDTVPLTLYILNGDELISDVEIDLMVAGIIAWIGNTVDPLLIPPSKEFTAMDLEVRAMIAQRMNAGALLDADSAKTAAMDIAATAEYWGPTLTYQQIVNAFLYDALSVASADTLHANETAHFYSVAEHLGIAQSADAIFQLCQLEKQLKQTFDNLF